jgi:cyclophilin family peptidyl-prolyl cis-trans isomerase
MSSRQRPPKRQRKKEAAAARRDAMRAAMERRRRVRMYGIVGATAALLLGGGAIAAIVANTGGSSKPTPTPKASPTPAPSPAPIACDAKLPAAAGSKKPTFSKADDMKLSSKKTYLLRLETSCGTIDIKLAVAKSPKTANSIVFLAKKGFYDGLTFHRIVPGFVIQGGDPQGTGSGGPGYSVVDTPPKGAKYTKGVVAMAKTGSDAPGTSGSQFFIVSGADAGLPAEYAVLGEVIAGLDAVSKIEETGQKSGNQELPPKAKTYIERATIVEQ